MIKPRALHRLWAYLARRDRWKLHLGVGAGSVLMAGISLAPQAPAPVVKAPEENSVPLLREELQRRDARTVFRDVRRLADQVGDAVVGFVAASPAAPLVHPDFGLPSAPPRPALGQGLVVSAEGDVLSHAAAIGRQVEVDVRLAGGAMTHAAVTAYERDTGLVLLRLATAGPAAPVSLVGVQPPPGDVLAAVTRSSDAAAPVAQPVYVASESPGGLALAAFSEGLVPGTPLFTLDGSAIAVVGDTPHTAWPAARAVVRLSALASTGRGVPVTIGVRLQAVAPPLRPFVGDVAAVVVDADREGPAARAGVRVGDGLRAVNGTVLTDLPDAMNAIASLPTYEPSEVVVVRDSKEIRLLVPARPTLAAPDVVSAEPLGDSGPTVSRLFSPEAVAEADIPADARVLALDGRAMSERTALAYLRRVRGPRLLYLAHSGQRFFAVAEARR